MTACLILAAGQGSRLRPLTQKIPKGMVHLIGKPLIMHQLETLQRCGITNIGIITGYQSDIIDALGYRTFKNKKFDKTNMLFSLMCGRHFFEKLNEDLIIAYSDIVYQSENLLKLLQTKGDLAVMVDRNWQDLWKVRNENVLNDAETLKYGIQNQIIEIGKKPQHISEIMGQYTGLVKVPRSSIPLFIKCYDSLLEHTLDGDLDPKTMYMTDFIQFLIDKGWRINPAIVENGWLEIDTVKDLNTYEKLYQIKKLKNLWIPHV